MLSIKPYFKQLGFIFGLMCFACAVKAEIYSESDWQIWRQHNSLSVSFQRAKNSDDLVIRAQLELDAISPQHILNWISQPEKIAQWMTFIDEIKTVEAHEQTKVTTLFNFKAVWPLAKRQMILTSEFQFTEHGFKISSVDAQQDFSHLLTYTIVSVPYSQWEVQQDENKQTSLLTYTSVTKLNGDTPNILTEKMVLRSIWQSFKTLNNLLK